MNSLKATELTEEQLINLWGDEALYSTDDMTVLFEVIEEGEWHDGGKYQDQQVVFREIKTGKTYSFIITRSGSYFSHYEYEVNDTAEEVKKVTETITVEKWVLV